MDRLSPLTKEPSLCLGRQETVRKILAIPDSLPHFPPTGVSLAYTVFLYPLYFLPLSLKQELYLAFPKPSSMYCLEKAKRQ